MVRIMRWMMAFLVRAPRAFLAPPTTSMACNFHYPPAVQMRKYHTSANNSQLPARRQKKKEKKEKVERVERVREVEDNAAEQVTCCGGRCVSGRGDCACFKSTQ